MVDDWLTEQRQEQAVWRARCAAVTTGAELDALAKEACARHGMQDARQDTLAHVRMVVIRARTAQLVAARRRAA